MANLYGSSEACATASEKFIEGSDAAKTAASALG